MEITIPQHSRHIAFPLLISLLFTPIPTRVSAMTRGRRTRPVAVSGVVVDPAGAPIAEAEIEVSELGRTVRSHADGRFTLPAVEPGEYTLLVRRAGYRTRLVTVTAGPGGASPRIVLRADPIPVDPVSVTLSREPLSPRHSPLSAASVDREALQRNVGISLAGTLEELPGVRTLSTGQEFGKPVIRGLHGARVVVLDDGLRLEDYAWSDEDAPSVDAAFADRVEVVRGPASVMYGPDAVGGVVNVIPRPVVFRAEDATGIDMEAEAGLRSNNREIDGVVRAEGGAGDWAWRGAGAGRFAEALHTPNGELENTGFGSFNAEGAVAHRADWGVITARFVHFGGEFKLLEQDGPRAGVPEEEEGGPERKLGDERLQVLGTFPMGGGLRLETRVQGQFHHLIELEDDPDSMAVGVFTETEIFNLTLATGLGEVLLHHRLGENVRGTVGVSGEYQQSLTSGEIPLIPDASTASAGVFALERWDTGPITLLAGGRMDYEGVSGDASADRSWTAVTWDAGAVWRPLSHVAINANVGSAWRPPTLFELFADGPRLGEGRYEIGSTALDAEHSLNLDAGIRWTGDRVTAQVAAYRNTFDGYFFVQPTADTINGFQVFHYDQAAATLEGGEASLSVEATNWLALGARADYVRGQNDDQDEPLPLIPPQRFDLRARFHGAWGPAGAPAYVSIQGRHVAAPDRLNPYDFDVSAYTLLGLGAGTSVGIGGRMFDVDLTVHNALNTEYRGFLSRYKRFALDPGRDIVLRVRTDI